MKKLLVIHLFLGISLLLTGCLPSSSSKVAQPTQLFLLEADIGQFSATAQPGVYELTTQQPSAHVKWFYDRPERIAGEMTLLTFLKDIWPSQFEGKTLHIGLSVRQTEDQSWNIQGATLLGMSYQADTSSLVWRLELKNMPDSLTLSKVLIYLDNEPFTSQTPETHVFMQAAALGEVVQTPNGDSLLLKYPLDALWMLAVNPQQQTRLVTNSAWVDELWLNTFSNTPPNAFMSIESAEGEVLTQAVQLTQPTWKASEQVFSYAIHSLLGDLPRGVKGAVTLYIDSWDDNDHEDTAIYRVVVNDEEQYSILLADRENPLGWYSTGFSGSKQACLENIELIWTDFRPLSLRKKMEKMQQDLQIDN